MHTFLEIVTSIISLVIATLVIVPVFKFLDKTANWEENDKDK